MRRYCKHVDITSIYFIRRAIYMCLDGKWRRSDVHEMLAAFSPDLTRREVERYASDTRQRSRLRPTVDCIAQYLQECIKKHDLHLRRIHIRTMYDGIKQKKRRIAIASMLQQICDYIAKLGLQELFDARFVPHQYATIPGRGQVYGKKRHERWMREQKGRRFDGQIAKGRPASLYCIDADVRKCYPSISVGKLKAHLRRDVKNDDLLWLTFALIDKMTREQYNLVRKPLRAGTRFLDGRGLHACRVRRGISIGSYLSCNLCNYIMSFAWRMLIEHAHRWETRKGRKLRVRLVTHCGIYMDNLTVYGANKRDLMRAQHMLEAYMRKELGMHIKSDWRLYRLDYIGRNGKRHGSPVDSMGFVCFRDHTRLRGSVFLRARRKYLLMRKRRLQRRRPSRHLCGSVVSYNGWFKHIDGRAWRRRNDYKYHIIAAACRQVARYMREEVSHHAKRSTLSRAAVAC